VEMAAVAAPIVSSERNCFLFMGKTFNDL